MNDHTDLPTDDVDDRLARILGAEADRHRPVPDWDDVTRRAAAHRGRRAWPTSRTLGPLAAVAAAIAVVVTSAVLLTGDRDPTAAVVTDQDGTGGQTPSTVATTTSTTTPASTTPTTSPMLSALPGTFTDADDADPLLLPTGRPMADDEVAAVIEVPSDDEFTQLALVVLSLETGDVVRTLTEGFDTVEGGIYRVHVTPDRRTVVYTVANSACTSRLEAVAADGSSAPIELRSDASALVISPDGSRVATVTGDECVSPLVIDIAPVAGGPAVRYQAAPDSAVSVDSIVWSAPDALTFAVSMADGILPPALHRIDVAARADEAVPSRGDGPVIQTLARTDDGRVTAQRRCCFRGESTGSSLVVLDGLTVVDEVTLDVDDPLTVRSATFDGAGRTLVVHAPSPEGDGGVNTSLFLDGQLLREAVALVAW